jgi:curved DNA-binding protein CbpA
MKNRRNCYRLLQVQPDASVEVIRASYRTLMLKLKQHPDLGGSAEAAAILNEAYEVLSDPDRRTAYDKELCSCYGRPPDGSHRRPLVTIFCPVCTRLLVRKPHPGERCPTCASPLQSDKLEIQQRTYQRAVARTQKHEEISYFSTWPGKPQKAKMNDFSPQGMRFLCEERLEPGTVLKISCPLLEASAWVTNMQKDRIDGQSQYAIGVSFLAVTFLESRGSFLSTSA